MSFEHNAIDDSGIVGPPNDRDWSGWVSASRTRNWCLQNPLQDWLELYGDAAGSCGSKWHCRVGMVMSLDGSATV